MITVDISVKAFLPAYRHLLESEADIHFLWGGRDSGKSYFIAQKLILDCLHLPYFRFILVKKTYESIKDAQYQLLKDIITSWGLQSMFSFRESPLEIRCKNGNKFIARGCDKPEKLKSIADPSGVWFEEADQLTEEDYDTISTSLRAPDGVKITQWMSLNPEGRKGKPFEEHWIDTRFLASQPYGQAVDFAKTVDVEGREVAIKCTSTHTTYRDNKHCPDSRRAIHELLASANPAKWRVYSQGLRGVADVDRPFAYNFSPARHVRDTEIKPGVEMRFSIDFNVDPFVCIALQVWQDSEGHHVHIHDEIVLRNQGVVEMIDTLKTRYPMGVLLSSIWTGDATQQKRSVDHNISKGVSLHAWERLSRAFKLRRRMHTPRANLAVPTSRENLNFALAVHPDLAINPKCKLLISEVQFTEATDDGHIKKDNRKDATQRADALDCLRYAVDTWLADIQDKPHKYGVKMLS